VEVRTSQPPKGRLGSLLPVVPRKLFNEIHDWRPDIVHFHGEYNAENLFVPMISRAPVVLSFHGAAHPVVLAKGKKMLKRAYIGLARRALYRRVSRFHALSPSEKVDIQNLIPESRTYTVPQGPNLRVSGEQGRVKQTAGAGKIDEITFIFVGRLDVYTKELDLLVRAFSEVLEAFSPNRSRLLLVGPDWKGGAERIRSLAAQLGCLKQIDLVGVRTGTDLRDTIEEADIYVHLSRHEGFGLALAEALVLGKPSIVSAAVGTASWPEVREARYVRVVEPEIHSATAALIEFGRRRSELAHVARRHCHVLREFFCWDRIAREHLAEYERIRGEYRSGQ
jgi:glycosyltransferase involved in cell wall biosynthesis